MTEHLPYVTTSDGRKWSAQAVSDMEFTLTRVLRRRDQVQLELDLLKGKIHMLDRGVFA